MTINGHKIPRPQFAAYDGCHKIYIPVKGKERGFVKRMQSKGWIWPDDYYKIEKAQDLANIYIDSCPLRFIEQCDFKKTPIGWEEKFTTLIPQCAFTDSEGLFDENAARAAFADR